MLGGDPMTIWKHPRLRPVTWIFRWLLRGFTRVMVRLWGPSLGFGFYETLADARAARVFGEGWMPDILPPSARSLFIACFEDPRASVGHFRYNSAEYEDFVAQLEPTRVASNDSLYATRTDCFAYTHGEYVWYFWFRVDESLCSFQREARFIEPRRRRNRLLKVAGKLEDFR